MGKSALNSAIGAITEMCLLKNLSTLLFHASKMYENQLFFFLRRSHQEF